jgi:hypothetical protein
MLFDNLDYRRSGALRPLATRKRHGGHVLRSNTSGSKGEASEVYGDRSQKKWKDAAWEWFTTSAVFHGHLAVATLKAPWRGLVS